MTHPIQPQAAFTLGGALYLTATESAATSALLNDPLLVGAPEELHAAARAFDQARRHLLRVATAGDHAQQVGVLAQEVADAWARGEQPADDLAERARAAVLAEQTGAGLQRVLTLAASSTRDTLTVLLSDRAADVIAGPLRTENDQVADEYEAALTLADGRDFATPDQWLDATEDVRAAYFEVRKLAERYARLRQLHRVWLNIEAPDSDVLSRWLQAHQDESPTSTTGWPTDPLAAYVRVARQRFMPTLAELEETHPSRATWLGGHAA